MEIGSDVAEVVAYFRWLPEIRLERGNEVPSERSSNALSLKQTARISDNSAADHTVSSPGSIPVQCMHKRPSFGQSIHEVSL